MFFGLDTVPGIQALLSQVLDLLCFSLELFKYSLLLAIMIAVQILMIRIGARGCLLLFRLKVKHCEMAPEGECWDKQNLDRCE